jgi:hypothetical protein
MRPDENWDAAFKLTAAYFHGKPKLLWASDGPLVIGGKAASLATGRVAHASGLRLVGIASGTLTLL